MSRTIEDNKCCSCECGDKNRLQKIKMGIGVALFAIGMLFDFSKTAEFCIFFASYLLIGGDVLKRALANIKNPKNLFDENFLMSIATIGAFAIGEYPEGAAVMLFYQIGEGLQDRAVDNSKKSISALLDIKPQFANLKTGSKIVSVFPSDVKKGDIVIVKAGEKIPLDGVVIEGRSFLDMSALSGESVPKEVDVGSQVLSGSINKSGLLSVRVTNEFEDSMVSKIAKFVQNASKNKAKTERFITRFARIYTPIVVAGAAFLAILPPLFTGGNFEEWFYKALIFLVISCPCALVISIPLSFFAGIGGASKHGILVKGGDHLEALSFVDTIAFDKTGTLTKGRFEVCEISPSGGFGKDELLFFAAHAESVSPHPIAVSIINKYAKTIDPNIVSEGEDIFGLGVKAKINGRTVLAGNEKMMYSRGISHTKAASFGSVAYVAIDNVYAGYIAVADEIKEESFKITQELQKLNVNSVVMLTGDSKAVGEETAKLLNINEVFSELLPLDKVDKIETLLSKTPKGKKLAFVGDGVNDAPSLVKADIGIAFGALGSDITAEAADIVLMNDNPLSVVKAIKISKKTINIAKQNIALSLGVKVLFLTLGVMGISGMWGAIFADVGVAVLAVLNAARAFRV